mgnify:CR=1 FL=1|tara:strand:+ start:1105 stop:1740 length:636 start_codon:yes stop_codon:yes gene_type:complete
MKIYLDTADVKEVHKHWGTGLIDGVTTSLTTIRLIGRNPDDVYAELLNMGVEHLCMEVEGGILEMMSEAERLNGLYGDAAVIRVPCTRDGLFVCKELTKKGIRVSVMLVYSAAQAILAHKAGAVFVTVAIGDLDAQSVAGLEVVRSIAEILPRDRTQVVASSIESIQRVVRSFYNGASIVAMPPKVFSQMYDHALTRENLRYKECTPSLFE